MSILSKLRWRYATKKFDSKKIISEQKIEIIKEAFNLTATSYGLQPVKLLIIKDKTLQSELQQFSMNQQQVSQASHLLLFCAKTSIDKPYIASFFENVKTTRNIDDSVISGFRDHLFDTFSSTTDAEVLLWAKKQAYLTMGNLLTVCAIEGIDACPMEGFEPKKFDTILGLESHGLQSVLLMPIGIRAEDDQFAFMPKVRLPIKDAIMEFNS